MKNKRTLLDIKDAFALVLVMLCFGWNGSMSLAKDEAFYPSQIKKQLCQDEMVVVESKSISTSEGTFTKNRKPAGSGSFENSTDYVYTEKVLKRGKTGNPLEILRQYSRATGVEYNTKYEAAFSNTKVYFTKTSGKWDVKVFDLQDDQQVKLIPEKDSKQLLASINETEMEFQQQMIEVLLPKESVKINDTWKMSEDSLARLIEPDEGETIKIDYTKSKGEITLSQIKDNIATINGAFKLFVNGKYGETTTYTVSLDQTIEMRVDLHLQHVIYIKMLGDVEVDRTQKEGNDLVEIHMKGPMSVTTSYEFKESE